MPWTAAEFAAKHNHSLSPGEAKKAAKIANAVLEKTGSDESAIRIANSQMGKYKAAKRK